VILLDLLNPYNAALIRNHRIKKGLMINDPSKNTPSLAGHGALSGSIICDLTGRGKKRTLR
jgi:hypothetical protein